MTTKVSKKQRVLDAMKNHKSKTITVFHAFNYLGETRLSGKIHELRKDGHIISKEMLKGTNRLGDEIWYAKYKLEKEAE
jgi:hypothetical protein